MFHSLCKGLFLTSLLILGLVGCGSDPAPVPPLSCATDLDCPDTSFCRSKVCEDAQGMRHDLGQTGQARLVMNAASGAFDLYSPDKLLLIKQGYAYAALSGYKTELKTTTAKAAEVKPVQGKDELGTYQSLQMTTKPQGTEPTMVWQVRVYQDGAYVFRLGLRNDAQAKVVVDKLVPLRIRGSAGGGLFLGKHPRTQRILENGSAGLMDHFAALEMGDKERDGIIQIAPGKLEGYSASNWSHLIWDSDNHRVWMAGAITAERAISVLNTTYEPGDKELRSPDGRTGFGFYSLDCLYLPQGKPIQPGSSLHSESFYLHPTQAKVHQALEDFAQAIHDKQKIVTWTERGFTVPNGWNSWAGSGGTGGYGTSINQTLMEQNLAVMRDYFRDWGMDYFQMDDGWEPDYGDWQINKTRFPDGFTPQKGIVGKTLDAKMIPGLWIAAFSAYKTSQLYKTNQAKGWFMTHTLYGQMSFSDYMMLDMTRADVLAWLKALGSRIRNDWGFRWLKLDFSYPALLCEGYDDPSLTNVEMYDQGLKALREGLGQDVFFLNIGAVGVGRADAKRTTLDNAPVWDWDTERNTMRLMRQGFKPTMSTAARRYFYQGKVFINHPDLIIFRSDTKNLKLPRITFNEARAFSAFVAATGGIVKLGDKVAEDLAPYPQRVNVIRQILPIHPQPSRPLDLMTREFPEQYFKKIQKTLGGLQETWGWYAAFNLGLNWDFSTNPATKMDDNSKQRTFTVDPVAQGMPAGDFHVFEFWTQKYEGQKSGKFQVSIPSHDCRVYAIRPKKDHPQLLGHNRHITMGAAVTRSQVWDKSARTLTLTMDVVKANKEAPFVYKVSIHGNGAAFKKVTFSTPAPQQVKTTESSGVLEIRFTPSTNGPLKVVVEYG